MKICFATNNPNKLKEIQSVLGDNFELLTLKDISCNEELPETQTTIEGNSLEKAQYVWNHYHINCFSDDSGLLVDALNGEPGVDSAHYAGKHRSDEDNIKLLLQNMANQTNRKAQFKTVVTLILNGEAHQFEGIIEGEILIEKRGNQGFGYDPIFLPTGYSKTFAEMDLEEKKKISHRSLAFSKMENFLKK